MDIGTQIFVLSQFKEIKGHFGAAQAVSPRVQVMSQHGIHFLFFENKFLLLPYLMVLGAI